MIINMHTQVTEDEQLKKFRELESENMCNKNKILTPEEQACEDYFAAITRRDSTGRSIVSFPFRQAEQPCGSKSIAIKRLQGLERKLKGNSRKKKRIKNDYTQVIHKYIELGHIEKISEEENTKGEVIFLPNHAVVREDNSTTKTMFVFDATCKETNGVSLNDILMTGPTLQDNLRHMIMRWRQHHICPAAVIIKMYRQVAVSKQHVDFQRNVWRDKEQAAIEEYILLRVTFGTSCAYLAVKALQQTARDEGHAYPLAAEKVLNDFHMDDLMTGCNSVTGAIQLHKELNELLNKGGFKLQNK